MNQRIVLISALSLSLAIFAIITVVPAQTKPGGLAKVAVTKQEIKDAAAFAIKAQSKKLQDPKEGQATKLELLKIIAAEEQVGAGMNYRLRLQVKVNGKEKQADAEIWWQAWRKPDPYQLTSWKWIGE